MFWNKLKRIGVKIILIVAGVGIVILGLAIPGNAQSQKCDPAYPVGEDGRKICISPPPPDLDCSDISYRRFKVLPPDPHHFDRDHDGIGCELDS